MVRDAVKINTAIKLFRVTPSPFDASHTGKSLFHSLGQYHHGHLDALSHQSLQFGQSPSSAIGIIDPITETEFEFVLAAYMLPLSGIVGYYLGFPPADRVSVTSSVFESRLFYKYYFGGSFSLPVPLQY